MYNNQFLRYFASRLRAHNQWTTPEDARELFEAVTGEIPDIDDLRSYLVFCHIAGIDISPHSASEYARFREELTAIDSEPEIE